MQAVCRSCLRPGRDVRSETNTFGPYRLDALLGRGGMGEVYRAFDSDHGRAVAVKRLAPHLADDPEFQLRFRREARLAAGLRSPHVIPIHRYGEIDGQLYIDMRYVAGRARPERHHAPRGRARADPPAPRPRPVGRTSRTAHRRHGRRGTSA